MKIIHSIIQSFCTLFISDKIFWFHLSLPTFLLGPTNATPLKEKITLLGLDVTVSIHYLLLSQLLKLPHLLLSKVSQRISPRLSGSTEFTSNAKIECQCMNSTCTQIKRIWLMDVLWGEIRWISVSNHYSDPSLCSRWTMPFLALFLLNTYFIFFNVMLFPTGHICQWNQRSKLTRIWWVMAKLPGGNGKHKNKSCLKAYSNF